jgi:predicted dehydrogenase
MTGADIAWVQAESVNAPWNWNKGDATVMAQLGLSNGAAANYVGSWVAMGRETTWNADWRLEGSKGVLAIEDDEVRFADTPARGRKVRLLSMSKTDQAYLLDDFARDLDEGREPETSGENNLNSLAATFAVVESIKKGRRVEVQDLLGSK